MDAEGGSLDSIIAAFGTSDEFNRRYGGLTQQQLITKIYQQALNRNPDPAGLAYYLGELQAGRKTLQTITLEVLNGATTPPDSTTIANKLAVADFFTAAIVRGCDYGGEATGVDALTAVTSDGTTVISATASIDLRCFGVAAIDSSRMPSSYRLNVLDFELPNLLGKNVWVMGYYGNKKLNGDGVGFLVDNPLHLEVDEELAEHSFACLDGNMPPDDWHGSEVLVYGTVKDYAQTYGAQAVLRTPLVTVIQIQQMRPAVRTNSWDDRCLLDTPAAALVSAPAGGPASPIVAQAVAITGNKAQPCDRSVIISGGVDASTITAATRTTSSQSSTG